MTPGRAGPAVGVDIGGTKMLGVRLADGGGVDVAEMVLVPAPRRAATVVGDIAAVVAALGVDRPASIGVGTPGLVDNDGALRFSPHLPGLVGLPLTPSLAERWPATAVWVGNDATAAGWAEHRAGAGRGHDDLLMITLGTGIGGGIINRGRLTEGAHRYAGEFGHMVVDPHGPACPCGKRGCWERFASGSGLGLLGREAAVAGQAPRVVALAGGDPEAVRGEHVTVAAAEGDGPAADIMARFAWWLALGLSNLANAFDPGLIVLGGGLIEAGEVLMEPARRAFADLVEAIDERAGLRLVPAQLGSRAGAIGAALLAAGEGGREAAGPAV